MDSRSCSALPGLGLAGLAVLAGMSLSWASVRRSNLAPKAPRATMASSVKRFDIAIAGGGSAGLALACALADALGTGVRIALVDRLPLRPGAAPADARAFALSAGARRMLSAL